MTLVHHFNFKTPNLPNENIIELPKVQSYCLSCLKQFANALKNILEIGYDDIQYMKLKK